MRVIAGKYKGHRLKTLKGDHTRPTSDKIREAVFHQIGPYFSGGKLLDLYGGSGAVTIEALSRGMQAAVICERYRPAIQVIRDNLAKVGLAGQVVCLKMDVKKVLKSNLLSNHGPFDLVYIDPPYAKQTIVQDFLSLQGQGLLAEEAIVLCELDARDHLAERIGDWTCCKEMVYGATKLYWYTYTPKIDEKEEQGDEERTLCGEL